MKTGWLIAGGIAVYLIYQGTKIANTVQQLTYSLAGIKHTHSDLFKTELLVTLRVSNNNPTQVAFDSFSGSLIVSGQTLAQAACSGAGKGIVIKPSGTTDISFPVTINHLNLALNLKTIVLQWATGTITNAITLIGNLQAAGISIPINQTVNLSGIGRINGVKRRQSVLG